MCTNAIGVTTKWIGRSRNNTLVLEHVGVRSGDRLEIWIHENDGLGFIIGDDKSELDRFL